MRRYCMKIEAWLAVLALAATSLPAAAEGEKVLRGKDLTESALIEALSPDSALRLRSIRVERDKPNLPAPKPSASVLITFLTNSAELTPQAKQSLDVVGRALNADKLAEFKFVIEGHADPRGTTDLNQRLSQERAESVRQYLVQNHGIGAERLKAIGKGDREPLNKGNPAAPENRRVTIVTITN